MKMLKDCVSESSDLAIALRERGESHRSYKVYTSMERALAFLLTGDLFLSNGSGWNDTDDVNAMETKRVFAHCFSCSTRENIAMWMLYSGDHGKKGAVIDFLPSVMTEVLHTNAIELGFFDDNGQFSVKHILNKADGAFDIFVTDVVYVDPCKDGKVKLTVHEDHTTAKAAVLSHRDIFYKNYAWSYERECRLVIRLSDSWEMVANRNKLSHVKLTIPRKSLRKMQDNRLIRSPLYNCGVENGRLSDLNGIVKWNI